MNILKRKDNLRKEKGIQISRGVDNNSPAKNQILMWLVRVLIIFAGTFGALYSFVSGYELNYEMQFFITVSLMCGLLFGTLYGFKKIAVYVFSASVILLLIIGYLNGIQLYSFFARTWNECVRFLAVNKFQFPKLSTLGLVEYNETFLWILIALMFSAIIGFFAVCKTHFLPVFILTFVPMEFVIYFGFVPDLFSVICIFACNGAVISMSAVKLKKKYFVNTEISRRGLSIVSLIMCIFFTAALCFSNWGVAISGYERPEEFNEIRKAFANIDINELMSDKKETVDLKNQSSRKTDMEDDLYINMQREESSVYLKCRTGSVYEDNKWYGFDSSVYSEAPVNMMKSQGISISDVFATSDNGKRSLGLMTVKPVMENSALMNFTYLPYGFYNDGSLTVVNDEGAVRTDSINSTDNMLQGYSISYDKRVNNFWGELQRDKYFYRNLQYTEISRMYTDFVKTHYIDVPDNLTRLKETAEELKADIVSERENVVYSVEKVREYLRKNAEYSLEPGAVPNGEDFTEHFLFENKKGFCVHFATAGVMLLRAMGIPSRYASGYIISDDDFDMAKEISDDYVTVSYLEDQKITTTNVKQQTVSVTLTDANAHAWAEVYIDGLGWIPCEMTPGYSQSENGLGDLSYSDVPSETEEETPPETTEPVTEETTQVPTTIPTEVPVTTSDAENLSDTSGLGISVLLIILAVIVLIIAADLIVRLIIVKRRKRKFKCRNLNKNAENLYLYLARILSCANFHCLEKENLTDSFEKIFKKFDFVDEEKCVETVIVLQKLFYGNANISKEELVIVEKFVLGFVRDFMDRQTKLKKFVYKFILFLI